MMVILGVYSEPLFSLTTFVWTSGLPANCQSSFRGPSVSSLNDILFLFEGFSGMG